MSYFEHIKQIQVPHTCVRNKAINIVNTSSDMCVFEYPQFTMSGASKIPCDADYSAVTTATTYVYEVTTATTQDLTFEFTANTTEFTDKNTSFKYEIYKLNPDFGYFQYPPIYKSNEVEWSSFSGTSAFTHELPLSSLSIDGDYLIKGYFVHDVCTEFATKMGYRNDTSSYRNGDYFGLYEPDRDFYMVIFKGADTPIFDGAGTVTSLTALNQRVVIPFDGQTEFILPGNVEADFIVTLNGLTLSNNFDYTISQYTGGTQPYVITMTGETFSTDIVTFIYGATSSGGLKSESIDVTSITSGATNGEGSNQIYFNTTTGKYEMFLTLTPSSPNTILVMINGVTLANGVDFYQSITNPKRIIFEGTILVGDIITTVYVQGAEFVDSINTSTPNISWSIANRPTEINGKFILEVATDKTITTVVSSAETNYVVGQTAYSLSTIISGTVGTQLYYRVTNLKNYTTICGDVFDSTAYSEVVPITIATNSINSY